MLESSYIDFIYSFLSKYISTDSPSYSSFLFTSYWPKSWNIPFLAGTYEYIYLSYRFLGDITELLRFYWSNYCFFPIPDKFILETECSEVGI